MNAKDIKRINALEAKIEDLQGKVREASETFSELRLKALQTVEMVKGKDGKVVALVSGKRRLSVSYNTRYHEYTLKENGKVLCKQMRCSIHELRFAIAMGDF